MYPLRLKLVQEWSANSVNNSNVWDKWYGLAECLKFHSWWGGEGEFGKFSPYHYTSWLRERGREGLRSLLL
jgi:hypothetical protein